MPIPLLSVANLPDDWRRLLRWGPCFCEVLAEPCPSCAHAAQLESAGLDWAEEYRRALDAGEAILL
jgi:hypothetical protein